MNKGFFYVSYDGRHMLEGHSDIPEFCFIEIVKDGQITLKKVTHDEWMKHHKLTIKNNSLFDLENKKMSLRIARSNLSFDIQNKYYKKELERAEQEVEKEILRLQKENNVSYE